MNRGKVRFNLFPMFVVIIGAGVVFALIGALSEFQLTTWQFSTLPADDSAVRAWIVKKGYGHVSVQRSSNMVSVKSVKPLIPGSSIAYPVPPWESLGYGSPEIRMGSRGLTLNGRWVFTLPIGVAALVLLFFLRKRFSKPETDAAAGDLPEDPSG